MILDKLGSNYYKGRLSIQGQHFYDRLNAQLIRQNFSGRTSFLIHDPQTAANDCFRAFQFLKDDHPEYFFLGFENEFTLKGQFGTLEYPILYSPETIERIRRQMHKTISRITGGIAQLDILNREIQIYDRIVKNFAYSNNNDVRDHSVVGPVLMSSGVCEGLNALLLLCLRNVGIPCIKVFGKSKEQEDHCWTIAWINGTPVHCDVTWDITWAGDSGLKGAVPCFNYFNLSDEQIASDHYAFNGYHFPRCSREDLSYFNNRNLCVHSYADLRIRIRKDLHQGISPIVIHFCYDPPSGDFIHEVKKAFSTEWFWCSYKLFINQSQKNVALIVN